MGSFVIYIPNQLSSGDQHPPPLKKIRSGHFAPAEGLGNACRVLVGISESKHLLEEPRGIWSDINMDLKPV
jgi:hypothetical protein